MTEPIIARFLRWLVGEQKQDSSRDFDQSFVDELTGLAKIVRPRPKMTPKVEVKNSQGDPMMCIMGCGQYATKISGGRFCEEHDDD